MLIKCRIRFLAGTLKGLEVDQFLPSSAARVGHKVQPWAYNPDGYEVVAVLEARS